MKRLAGIAAKSSNPDTEAENRSLESVGGIEQNARRWQGLPCTP